MTAKDFRISNIVRSQIKDYSIYFKTDNPISSYYKQSQDLSYKYNKNIVNSDYISASKLNTCAILHYLYQNLISQYLQDNNNDFFSRITPLVTKNRSVNQVLAFYAKEFPSPLIASQELSIEQFTEETARGFFIHRVMTHNPALMKAIKPLIYREELKFPPASKALSAIMGEFSNNNVYGSEDDLFTFLLTPSILHPDSLIDQINFILEEWADLLSEEIKINLIKAIDLEKEENKPVFFDNNGGGGKSETYVPDYSSFEIEYEAFTDDRNWMPNVVMIAKSTLVWLDQLSKYYNRPITNLDQIPDEELDNLKNRGFTALWLIGLWQRSDASKKIKNLCGNQEAEASAYSLKNNQISESIGGWQALKNLKERCDIRGIRLASDMVPNHTGIDSDWVINNPELFIQQDYAPFPSYTYEGPDLSTNPNIELKIEDHYYNQSDAAVTFRRRDKNTNQISYIFHGNDGTSMPWNDTAQLDYLNPLTREAVFQEIRHVALNFSIIRFDAAMTLAKKHIQRLWYPKLGHGGDIAGRTIYSMSDEEFNNKIPKEFWREVVDRMAEELPDTLLLAEAFWMMEGYFVRTLGMHRVYNSAFMNMLKNQENNKYIESIKTTLSFDPEILKRYVNFMSNPDEETAIGQFGDGDKYFGVCTLLSTMPGLPMFGHGQIEGFKEKYGMEYKKAYWDEWPNEWLINEHYKKIFPLLKKRYLFSGVQYFNIYDLLEYGNRKKAVFCYSNGTENEKTLVFYNNQYESVEGNIKLSAPKLDKNTNIKVVSNIAENLNLSLSGKTFLIYKNFNDGLTYLTPSLKIYDEGFWIHLNGYETKVLLDIREVEDIDGAYSKLYSHLSNSGVEDINLEINAMRLSPVYKAMDNLRSPFFLKTLDNICKGSSTIALNKKLILQIVQLYSYLPASYSALSEVEKTYLSNKPRALDQKIMLDSFDNFSRLFKNNVILSNTAFIMDELPIIISASLFIYPFIEKESSYDKINKLCNKLLLHHFYKEALSKLEINKKEINHIIEGISIYLGSFKLLEKDNKLSYKSLFDNPFIKKYTLCNDYNNVTWYKKEAVQELIVLSALSKAVFEKEPFDVESYISKLLKAEEISEYKLENFLKNID
ncbi:MAG: alpha-amylase [Spirochaetia bacterium]|nr:alpha-amylase [Spirochaetia bacterium]